MVRPRVASLVLLLASGCFSPSGSESTTAGPGTGETSETTAGPGQATSTSTGSTSPSEPTSTGPTTSTSGPVETTTTTSEPDTTSPASTDGASCGDGVAAPDEECDDGNMVDGDGCSSACKIEFCGDLIVQPHEECDGGEGCDGCVRAYFHVFVTSLAISIVEFKDIGSADQICRAHARLAGLPGEYVAWLSTEAQTAADRLVHSTRPWQLRNGVQIAKDWYNLIDGDLDAAIDRDENGDEVSVRFPDCGPCPVWTATTKTGLAMGKDCDDWSAPGPGPAQVGECSLSDARWTEGCPDLTCSGHARLYCFEQPPPP
ncbi:Myxococcus cysteine-rich repeat-containing protein [Nannocystis exedens]|uniref:Myxococcus cysteine-rich repeat-containing protein n=1 Tax=Nannocystis exedens TaxID=54 RepID=A0A1I1WC12_9BACT|nr:myxococcus cysteine-rich repeat containing protein [Nannocystis exedens]PCC67606.1 hypothetical protein NAEX_00613 [Nannocystis exedens]SFD92687.1 Myxococcus cysteine-rich repeat-containing protein [Nannocystis exedens]